ncbi:MAG: hypothetical protein U0871_17685 [Gemmataceae bacterium]
MFTVIWRAAALDAVSDLYVTLNLDGQNRLASAIDSLNHRLAADPLDVGESREGSYRVAFPDVLVVSFWVDTPAALVQVVSAARFSRQRPGG